MTMIKTQFRLLSSILKTRPDEVIPTQRWANSGPRDKCGPPQRFKWPAEAFMKNLQI